MSPPRDEREFRGGEHPLGYLTLEEGRRLRGLTDRHPMTVRRHLEPARSGRWLPPGKRAWTVLYDEHLVAIVADALAAGALNPLLPRPQLDPAPPRACSTLPTGVPVGWSTVGQIWRDLGRLGVTTDRASQRYVRTRLIALGVPSERRVVTARIERVFVSDRAVTALLADAKFIRKVHGLY